MGGTSVKLGVCRGSELQFHANPIQTEEHQGAESLLEAMTQAIFELQRAYPDIRAVGVGVPGFTDVTRGMVHQLTNVPGWKQVPLNSVLTEAVGLPCFVENDANCMAFAEFKYGAGIGSTNMVGVTLGTGVGGGLIINGQLFHGSASVAGEIGQMSIDYRGKDGTYGNTGALEEYLGIREITDRAVELYAASGNPRDQEQCEPEKLAAAATSGDEVARQVWDEFTTKLACGLANCVWLLNPDAIVIGGGIAKAGNLIFDPLRRKLSAQLHESFCTGMKIVSAKFGNEAGIIGSAAVALERV